MALRWADGTLISPRPCFLPEFVNRVGRCLNFSWLYSSSTLVSTEGCVGYKFTDDCFYDVHGERVSHAHMASKNVTKRYTICRHRNGVVVCTVANVKARILHCGNLSILEFSTASFCSLKRQTHRCRFYYRGANHIVRVEVKATWKHAMLRLKHVLRVRARCRIASFLLPCLPCATDVCYIIASYVV